MRAAAPFQKFLTTGPPFAANWQLVMSIEEPTSSFKTHCSLFGSGFVVGGGVSPVISLTSWGSTNARICAWIALESFTRPRRMQNIRCKVSMYPCNLPHPFRRKTHRSALILVSCDMWMPLHVPCFTTQRRRITCDSGVDVSCCSPEKLIGYTVIARWLPINSHLTNVAMPPKTVHASHVGARGARILQSVKFQLPATTSTAQRWTPKTCNCSRLPPTPAKHQALTPWITLLRECQATGAIATQHHLLPTHICTFRVATGFLFGYQANIHKFLINILTSAKKYPISILNFHIIFWDDTGRPPWWRCRQKGPHSGS